MIRKKFRIRTDEPGEVSIMFGIYVLIVVVFFAGVASGVYAERVWMGES